MTFEDREKMYGLIKYLIELEMDFMKNTFCELSYMNLELNCKYELYTIMPNLKSHVRLIVFVNISNINTLPFSKRRKGHIPLQ